MVEFQWKLIDKVHNYLLIVSPDDQVFIMNAWIEEVQDIDFFVCQKTYKEKGYCFLALNGTVFVPLSLNEECRMEFIRTINNEIGDPYNARVITTLEEAKDLLDWWIDGNVDLENLKREVAKFWSS